MPEINRRGFLAAMGAAPVVSAAIAATPAKAAEPTKAALKFPTHHVVAPLGDGTYTGYSLCLSGGISYANKE